MIRKYFTSLCIIIVLFVGFITMASWLRNLGTLSKMFESTASTKFNGAVCFILAAASLFVINREHKSKLLLRIGSSCAWLIIIIAALTLVEYFTNIKIGIDQIIVNDLGAVANPGRIELI